jgi:poly-gamma-glutamate capsule biosynthesis protein CapA/YwtB (metallophosphatase superfamily)
MTSSDSRPLVLLSAGDFYLNRPDPMSVFGEVADLLKNADFLFVNQEGNISELGKESRASLQAGMICMRAPLHSVEALTGLGVDAVTLANNHGMDFGDDALLDTMSLLGSHGIRVAGAGADKASAHAAALTTKGGTTVAMLGYTTVFPEGSLAEAACPGMAGIRVSTAYEPSVSVHYQPGTPPTIVTLPNADDVRQMCTDIAAARGSADLVVVQFHWGVAGQAAALGYMKELGRAAVDAGADLVVGNHQHVLAGVEIYRDVPIYYGLNHFAFENGHMLPTSWLGRDDALIVQSEIRGARFVRHAVVPVKIDPATRNLSLGPQGYRLHIAARLTELSREYGTSFDLSDDGITLTVAGPAPGTPPVLRAPDILFDRPQIVADVSEAVGQLLAQKHAVATSV